ncbi:LysR substrate-binding domain-containing protein [Solirubrobacter sp. CPCC 204708]|uniref:LysR substrate-binding domain-containing protein n=1 Tax=Solirubrobacter deserti TaxID=2282478 RepID=A0ABT4RJS9_9ACTN|nr:LysR substrate-binding domain-containing protein [Solirubrobacter deserti]MDA0138783.1 LysR substrate-binding domain-containing protein [Solirubrobacter deserti]
MALGVHTEHPLAGPPEVERAALADETFAGGPSNWATRVAAARAFAAAGLERRVALEINDTRTMVEFVRHGVAVAFLAPSFVRDPEGIALISIRDHAPVFETFVAAPSARRLGAAAAALLALAQSRVATP